MRFSTAVAMLGASMAVASPIANLNKKTYLEKKAIVWDYVTEIKWVTVTAGQLPQTPEAELPATTVVVKSTIYVNPVAAPTTLVKVSSTSSSTPPPPPPAPTTSSTPPPAPVVVVVPATSAAPVAAEEVETPAVVATTAAAAAASTPSDFISTGEFYHNQHRKDHSAGDLTWDADLASYAQQLADTCVFAHDLSIGSADYGQNIDTVGLSGTNAATTVPQWDKSVVLGNSISNNWYEAEVGNYASLYGQSNPEEGSAQFLHFTQIVWKATTSVGCGVAYCGQNKMPLGSAYAWYTVCNYRSPGNYANEYATNVGKPLGLSLKTAPSPF
ncbi:CAP domain-containing protein [Bisporella sp. PMI_857]|nr:CAP domain-containing protein [Bisporella sp. PMI_857]